MEKCEPNKELEITSFFFFNMSHILDGFVKIFDNVNFFFHV